MAKSKAQAVRPQARTRRSHAAEAERWNRMLLIGGVGAVLLVIVGLLAFGWYQTQIKPLGKTVLQVGDIKFSLGHLERRMEMKSQGSPYYQPGSQGVLALATDTLAELEQEALLVQGSGELNITVTDADVAAEIRSRGGLSEGIDPELYAEEFRTQVNESGLKEREYLQMVRAEMLEQRVLDYFRFLAPAAEPQVRGKYLVIDDQENADQIVARIRGGEEFDAVAQELAGGQATGELDWSVRGSAAFLPDEAEDYLFDEAQPGQVSDPITSTGLYYIVQLLEREDERALDDTSRLRVAQRELREWLAGLDVAVRQDFTEEDEARALEDIFLNRPTRPSSQGAQPWSKSSSRRPPTASPGCRTSCTS